jgi:hypothetical protein
MTTLAPRRRPLFARRGRSSRSLRVLGLAAATLFVASMAFSMGVRIGSSADAPGPPGAIKSLIAANSP